VTVWVSSPEISSPPFRSNVTVYVGFAGALQPVMNPAQSAATSSSAASFLFLFTVHPPHFLALVKLYGRQLQIAISFSLPK
jgi:hypothetical protein